MSQQNWRTEVENYIRQEARPADKFGHQPRLYALIQQLGVGLKYDDEIVFAAAWMHDLGVFIGHRPEDPDALTRWNHIPYTKDRCRELLPGWGFPAHKLDGVLNAIEQHLPNAAPTSIEATLIHDADILEQLGATGCLRAFVKVGRDTRYQSFSSVLPLLERLCVELPGKLLLDAAKPVLASRIATTQALLQAIRAEAAELLY